MVQIYTNNIENIRNTHLKFYCNKTTTNEENIQKTYLNYGCVYKIIQPCNVKHDTKLES